jgi:Family of unknown function (DUF5360)
MSKTMSPRLRWTLLVIDIAFLAYWTFSALVLSGALKVAPSMMYADYDKPSVVAWNWSFLPIDLAFSLTGLSAVVLSKRGNAAWIALAIISVTLTSAAGGMAVAYWTLMGQFDPSWFLPNLAIFLLPFLFLPGLVRSLSSSLGEPKS